MKRNIIIITLTVILFSACRKDNVIIGGGTVTTEDRTQNVQKEFESIKINGSTDARITYGPAYKLEVSGYSNLVKVLSTEVISKILFIEIKGFDNVKNDNTHIILTIPRLPGLELNGDSKASVSGIFPAQESLVFRINGSGKINAEGANTNVNHAEFSIRGSGEIFAYDIISKALDGDISGSGEIKTSVFNFINADISGSGNIYYKGNPTVNSKISGSGKVAKVN